MAYLIFFSCPCHHVNNVFLFLFQNGLVTGSPEMFKLKSCIRRKTDSIDKRFCFDIEVVERFEVLFLLYIFNMLNYLFLCLDTSMKQYTGTCFSVFKNSMHIYFILLCIYSTNIYCMMHSINKSDTEC